MIPAVSIFTNISNVVLIILCGVVLLFLLKSITFKDKLWMASVASVLLIVLISIGQIVSMNDLAQHLRDREAALDTMKMAYATLKAETESAQSTFSNAKRDVSLSRQELDQIRSKVTAEFERTVREIRGVYANISDEELNRRFNNAVRKARLHLENNVFQ